MISKKSKYALNALLYLTREYTKGPILISQIAESENIPLKFLETILLEMKRAGFLGSKKGAGGGYYLRKDPSAINIADVMRVLDGPIALLPCVTYRFYERCEECKDEDVCSIRKAFQEVRETTVRILKGYSLRELVDQEDNVLKKI
ncbi:MAG: Rrf2 family transcriptional regulator [Bacteroidia bacterium]|nr:Rrf2 family transcriptional regulator [Bacteroidia bacterium]